MGHRRAARPPLERGASGTLDVVLGCGAYTVRKMCAVVHAVAVLTCRRILSESMHHESILYCTLLANELNILLHSFCHSRAQTFENDLQACKPLVQILSLMRQRIWIPSPRFALPLLKNPTELESDSQCAVLYTNGKARNNQPWTNRMKQPQTSRVLHCAV